MSHNNIKLKSERQHRPVVLVPLETQECEGLDCQLVTKDYLRALVEISGCLPLLAPTCFGSTHIEQYLSMIDGIYITGASSNIDPTLYGQKNSSSNKNQDLQRDLFDILLIRMALKNGIPIFGICRGMHELNIAFGGDIHRTQNTKSTSEHKNKKGKILLEERYTDIYNVQLVSNTWFAQLLNQEQFQVRSLCSERIGRLGRGLEPLAYAENGMIEAIHFPTFSQFTLAVQWHPEWQASQSSHSVHLFQAFGDACRKFYAVRTRQYL
ncbi:gamma-glutamyl-gamma-aminobutyrate hydrolase family protein [Janthinobacterium sp. Ant5-2-1]|uniref:gamma-glutamyl-gamma-aminobutyrate hydrolase family protein n=1 Tax=Janthinobacterium sp. Ant5-2-1 TaxID=1755239 RepID=UPI0009E8C8CD|nr:gamma-glutamyl-gamma-aminobutyrate hydrolase family protein [Janthinobacterium sp. Ant5-2-1]